MKVCVSSAFLKCQETGLRSSVGTESVEISVTTRILSKEKVIDSVDATIL